MLKSWVVRLALLLAVVAAILLPAAGLGNRLDLWSFREGFTLLRVGLGVTAAAIVVSLIALIWSIASRPRQGVMMALSALVIALAVAVVPAMAVVDARMGGYPAIHDITTDTDNPPEFIAVMPAREGANTAVYTENTMPFGPDKGKTYAEIQKIYYPDIQPMELREPMDEAFKKALQAAEDMGWEIVAAEPDTGRIEATATTFWFGFKDDVVIRLTPEEEGTRVDVRSLSRVGMSDIGANAKRVRAYMEKLQAG